MSLEVRTVADLHRTLAANMWRLPRDAAGVVAASPAGAVAAGIVASHLGLPLVHGAGTHGTGTTGVAGADGAVRAAVEDGRVLVVEASAVDGEARPRDVDGVEVAAADAVRVAVFADRTRASEHDLVLEDVAPTTAFEWSLFHGHAMQHACLDIDGVLCRDPTDDQNDDGPRYLDFLETAAPLVIPSVPVQALVTSRLERYREPTQRWLAAQGVDYGELIMMDHPDAAARSRAARQAAYKAAAYRASGAGLFVESDPRLAVQIAQLARRRVVAFPDGMVVEPSAAGLVQVRAELAWRRVRRRVLMPRRLLGRAYRRVRRA